MKKYKLIKEYLGSREVGTIVEKCTFTGSGVIGNNKLYTNRKGFGVESPENYPEFWEEVIEKDYEIISYVAKDNPTNITTKRRGAHLHEEYWTIHKVKRLSDGEVFTVGDSVKVYEYSYIKNITEIIINSNPLVKEGIWLRYDSGSSHLSHATKAKQPIFLTHDGKDIFAGDIVWYVNKENLYHDHAIVISQSTFNSNIHAYFLTEEEAKEYIKKNKVLSTTADGVAIYSYNTRVH
jgi:hypothetical protein